MENLITDLISLLPKLSGSTELALTQVKNGKQMNWFSLKLETTIAGKNLFRYLMITGLSICVIGRDSSNFWYIQHFGTIQMSVWTHSLIKSVSLIECGSYVPKRYYFSGKSLIWKLLRCFVQLRTSCVLKREDKEKKRQLIEVVVEHEFGHVV